MMNEKHAKRFERHKQRLLDGAARILHEYDFEWKLLEADPALGQDRPDAVVEIGEGERKTTFIVEIKIRPRTAQVGAIVAQLGHREHPGLLLADYINPELAEELRRSEVCFLDMEGNAYLRGEGMLVWVTGRKDTRRIQIERETRRSFQPTGLKVIFTLLCRPELVEKDYRTLAQVADVALGTVQWVMRDLIQDGYVHREGRTGRRLIQLDRLLDEWALGYARDLQPKLLLGRYETRAFEKWRDIDPRRFDAVWGGEPAAALITRYLKPETLTLWVDKPTPRLLAELGLRQDARGRVQIRQIFWKPELTAPGLGDPAMETPVPLPELAAPPVLVYAELLAIGDARTIETARKLRDEWIDQPLQRYRARAAV